MLPFGLSCRVPGFRLSGKALRDVAEIVTYHHRNSSANIANEIESQLFAEFRKIGGSPSIGHRRSDLTDKDVLFHYARPYFILFRRKKGSAQILRIVHESRDLRKFI